MNLLDFETIKKKTLIALFSDDYLLDTLVLKGGNAMNLVYKMYNRSSIDLDFSIENDFNTSELPLMQDRILQALRSTFKEVGLTVLDYKFESRPTRLNADATDFWGGYCIQFKLIQTRNYDNASTKSDRNRKMTIPIDRSNKRTMTIDISKHEYCEKIESEIENYTIYVYPPELIALEKVRAICQQTEEYREIVDKPGIKGRARDFFDIYYLCKHFSLDLTSDENREKLKLVFHAKRVPLSALTQIHKYKSIHEQDFTSVIGTAPGNMNILSFEKYYGYVHNMILKLAESFRVVEPPSL